MCVTSPPYWGPRDYDTDPVMYGGDPNCNHEWEECISPGRKGGNNSIKLKVKGSENYQEVESRIFHTCKLCSAWKGEMGRQPDYRNYIRDLCDIFDEVKRVIKDEGSLWVNIGDSMSGSGGKGNQYRGKSKEMNHYSAMKTDLPNKTFIMIPERFALEMISRGWILRQKIIWHKPNGFPHPVTDRCTINYEMFYHFVKKTKYYYNQQFDPIESVSPNLKKSSKSFGGTKFSESVGGVYSGNEYDEEDMIFGKNKRMVWKITTSQSKDKHFAVYPRELIRTPIKATCPESICDKCGHAKQFFKEVIEKGSYTYKSLSAKHSEDLTKMYNDFMRIDYTDHKDIDSEHFDLIVKNGEIDLQKFGSYIEKITGICEASTVKRRIQESVSSKYNYGWTKCDCNDKYHPGTVLDPFMGSGTTAIEALSQKKNFIGIELNKEYAKIAAKRIKLFNRQKLI